MNLNNEMTPQEMERALQRQGHAIENLTSRIANLTLENVSLGAALHEVQTELAATQNALAASGAEPASTES